MLAACFFVEFATKNDLLYYDNYSAVLCVLLLQQTGILSLTLFGIKSVVFSSCHVVNYGLDVIVQYNDLFDEALVEREALYSLCLMFFERDTPSPEIRQ